MSEPIPFDRRKLLRTWKEIANYLNVAVRTVQRWEKDEGLPIHRINDSNARPFAYTDELDNWLQGRIVPKPESDSIVPGRLGGKRMWVWCVLAAGILLTAATLYFLPLPFKSVPVRAQLEASSLKVFDAQNRLCWERRVEGFPIPNEWQWPGIVFDTTLVADIDRDGMPEILFNQIPDRNSEDSGKLLCFSHDGVLRWQHRFGRQMTFSGQSFSGKYVGRLVRQVEGVGKSYILTVACHALWYPTQVALLDPTSGSIVEEYWHSGALFHSLQLDLDSDRRKEVLLAGINNPGAGLGHPALLALRIPFSLTLGMNNSVGVPAGGQEMAYLLFPRSDVNQVTGSWPMINQLIPEGEGRFMVRIAGPDGSALFYYLSYSLELADFRYSDNFPAVHGRLQDQGHLKHTLDPSELQCLGRIQRFSIAPDGNSPAVSQFWKACE